MLHIFCKIKTFIIINVLFAVADISYGHYEWATELFYENDEFGLSNLVVSDHTDTTGWLVRHNDELECLSFPNLVTLDGVLGLYIQSNENLKIVSAPKLTTIIANRPSGANGIVWYN